MFNVPNLYNRSPNDVVTLVKQFLQQCRDEFSYLSKVATPPRTYEEGVYINRVQNDLNQFTSMLDKMTIHLKDFPYQPLRNGINQLRRLTKLN